MQLKKPNIGVENITIAVDLPELHIDLEGPDESRHNLLNSVIQ